MERAQRKLEHIKYALELGDGPRSTHFEDIRFLHNCLPEINPADIILSVKVLGKQLRLPFLIDAITGGTDAVVDVNAKVAQAAAALGIGMAVGSQYGAVRDGKGYASYEVVRKYNPDGLVFANISALATPEQAREAVKMLNADAIEVHLNPAQELFMGEGDKDFRGLLDNMLRIKDATAVPVIVKLPLIDTSLLIVILLAVIFVAPVELILIVPLVVISIPFSVISIYSVGVVFLIKLPI